MSTTIAPDLDVSDLRLWEDGPPHETFARLRREQPVHWSPLGGFPDEQGFWSITRYEDVATVGRDHKTFSSEEGGIIAVDKVWDIPGVPSSLELTRRMLIAQDPPRHDRLKALVQSAFTPKRALDHTDRMREIINLVYDRALERHPDGRIDLVQDVGIYVPAMVIGDMLGVPREDADKLVDWTNRTTAFEDPRVAPSPEDMFAAVMELFEYVNAMIETRRERADRRPADGAHAGPRRGRAPRARGDPHVLLPAHGRRQRQHAGHVLLGAAEPAGGSRADGARARAPGAARVGGRGVRPLPPGVRVHAPHRDARHRDRRTADRKGRQGCCSGTCRATATRRCSRTPTASTCAAARTSTRASAAAGRHFCLGAGLARLEMRLWLDETLRRFPNLAVDGKPTRLSSTFLNQYRTIPVSLFAFA